MNRQNYSRRIGRRRLFGNALAALACMPFQAVVIRRSAAGRNGWLLRDTDF